MIIACFDWVNYWDIKEVELTRIRRFRENRIAFHCPACNCWHMVSSELNGHGFNGDYEKPTLTPSVMWNGYSPLHKRVVKCHSFVLNGVIQFLTDCTHQFGGRMVELPPVDNIPHLD
jgi:hypothetical protein